MRQPLTYVLILAALAATPAAGRERNRPGGTAGASPAALQKVLDCRSLSDGQARLACFDAGVAALDEARVRGDVALIDREQVRETRRKLFGFTLPSFDFFGHREGDDKRADRDEFEEITATVRAVSRNADGYYILTLEDGARWEQTQPMTFGRIPKAGVQVRIKRAALGSFKMNIDGSPAVKARRIG